MDGVKVEKKSGGQHWQEYEQSRGGGGNTQAGQGGGGLRPHSGIINSLVMTNLNKE